MRQSFALSLLVTSAIALGNATAAAQAPKAEPAKAEPAKADAAKADAAKADAAKKEVRKDPEGKRGISPYMEWIAKGEASFVARDLPGAISAFQDAIKLDTEKMLGFYRLGEAQLESGKPEEAEIAWQAALNKKGPEELHAKVLFVLADLRERQRKWPAGKEAWAAYNAFIQNHPKAGGYPATPAERQKQADRRIKDEVDYGVVKERIAKRQAEKEAEAIENAKKDTRNR